MAFVDKNPEADDEDALEDQTKWEHRHIQNVVWGRRVGWTVESVIIGDDSGAVETYVIDKLLLRMIRESPNNTRQIKSKIVTTPDPTQPDPTQPDQPDDSDSNSHSGDVAVV